MIHFLICLETCAGSSGGPPGVGKTASCLTHWPHTGNALEPLWLFDKVFRRKPQKKKTNRLKHTWHTSSYAEDEELNDRGTVGRVGQEWMEERGGVA